MEKPSKHSLLSSQAPTSCFCCQAPLCLRKQVINLALGHMEQMFCLACLAARTGCQPADLLKNLTPYIQTRDCFKTEWHKYQDITYCPDPDGCLPNICFEHTHTEEI